MSTMTIADVSRKAYAGYGISETTGMTYFNPYATDLAQFDASEVIAFQVREFGGRYALDFLLSSPSLWEEILVRDWKRAMSLACPRRAPEPTTTGLSAYADVVFLCKFLNVDGIKLFHECSEIEKLEKYILIDQVKIHSLDLILQELDSEDLDGEYFVSSRILHDVGMRLVETGAVQEFLSDESSVRQYVDSLS